MISTRDLSQLPDVDRLRRILQSMAMLDAILSPEWEFRYYSFNAHWLAREQMGSMRDGSGNHFFAVFNAAGCFLKGFDHEAPMSPYASDPQRVRNGVLDGVPPEFATCLNEPAFCIEETSFCIWRQHSDISWRHGAIDFADGPDPDGSACLLSALDGEPTTYKHWAEDYYERPVDLGAVEHVYAHKALNEFIIAQLDSELSLDELAHDIEEIGYP